MTDKKMAFYADTIDLDDRLDIYLSKQLDRTRSSAQKLIDDNLVLVNGKAVPKSYKINRGDKIDVTLPEAKSTQLVGEDIVLDIVYEDSDLLVVNKPKGMVVHPAFGNHSGTLVNALLSHCKDSLSGINGVIRPGIVHRLDKDTSGLLIVAKNDAAHVGLSAQIKEHSFTRKYIALVHGNLKSDTGTIDKPIARHKTDRKKMAVVAGGRRAVTHYRVLERYGKFTLTECILETGRTHQIRVHMASLSHPIVGDSVYGVKKDSLAKTLGITGQMLHAKAIGFVHPKTAAYLEFESEPPQCFLDVLLYLRKING